MSVGIGVSIGRSEYESIKILMEDVNKMLEGGLVRLEECGYCFENDSRDMYFESNSEVALNQFVKELKSNYKIKINE